MTLTTPPILLTDGVARLLTPLKVIRVPAYDIAMITPGTVDEIQLAYGDCSTEHCLYLNVINDTDDIIGTSFGTVIGFYMMDDLDTGEPRHLDISIMNNITFDSTIEDIDAFLTARGYVSTRIEERNIYQWRYYPNYVGVKDYSEIDINDTMYGYTRAFNIRYYDGVMHSLSYQMWLIQR